METAAVVTAVVPRALPIGKAAGAASTKDRHARASNPSSPKRPFGPERHSCFVFRPAAGLKFTVSPARNTLNIFELSGLFLFFLFLCLYIWLRVIVNTLTCS